MAGLGDLNFGSCSGVPHTLCRRARREWDIGAPQGSRGPLLMKIRLRIHLFSFVSLRQSLVTNPDSLKLASSQG